MEIYIENNPIIPLSPGACLRVAASAKEGERSLTLQSFSDGAEGVKGLYHVHPHLNPPPSRGGQCVVISMVYG